MSEIALPGRSFMEPDFLAKSERFAGKVQLV